MTHIRNDRTRRQRRRAGTTLVLAAAAGGLLAAAMAGSPSARADDLADIVTDVQGSIAAGQTDFSDASADFSTTGDTNEGLIAAFAGFDNTFVSPLDYTFVGLTGEATGTDISFLDGVFTVPDSVTLASLTQAGQEAIGSAYTGDAESYFSAASSYLSGGEYFDAAYTSAAGSFLDVLAGQSDILAALFGAGL